MPYIVMRCPVCESNTFIPGVQIFDDRYGEPNIYQLARCKDCGHTSTAPRLQESDLPPLYSTYYPRKTIHADDVALEAVKHGGRFSRFIRWCNGTDNQGQYSVRAGETMLDVGCGSGVSLLEAKALGATAFGIEADQNVKPIAKAMNMNIHFGSLADKPFHDQTFDLIVMNQVIEHLPNPDLALQDLSTRLTSNGRMVLVFPNISSLWKYLSGIKWINWHVPYHLHHFDRKHFERMAERCGLRIVHIRTITPNMWTLLQFRAKYSVPQLGRPNPIWTNPVKSISPSAGEVKKLNPLRIMLKIGVLTVITVFNRIIDVCGKGDSLMVELRMVSKK